MIIVTFALPDESRDFVAQLSQPRRLRQAVSTKTPGVNAAQAIALRLRHYGFLHLSPIFGKLCGQDILVVHTGMGWCKNNHERLEYAISLKNHRLHSGREVKGGLKSVRLLIASGFAGALDPELKVGDVVFAENFSCPSLLGSVRHQFSQQFSHDRNEIERLKAVYYFGKLATHHRVAETAHYKADIAKSTGAMAVDMETAWISALCEQNQVPMLGMRVISDAADQRIPIPSEILFNTNIQRPRYLALPFYLLTHPHHMSPFIKFVRGIGPARQRLTKALVDLIKGL